MNTLDRDVAGAAAAHQTLLSHLDALQGSATGLDPARPSLLPDWTVGHVLTHIARNAEGLQRILDAAALGERGAMYPGGFEQRAADIEAGATRPAAALVDDVRRTVWSLEGAWARLDGAAWDVVGFTPAGDRPAHDVPWLRWREVSVHHVDLGLGYGWPDLPADYVRIETERLTMVWASRTPMGLGTLPAAALAAPPWQRLGWLLGRVDIDGLPAAGVYP